ncbi:MAG: hypothetical protein AABZ39_14360 [Spirochaetota bacterium]
MNNSIQYTAKTAAFTLIFLCVSAAAFGQVFNRQIDSVSQKMERNGTWTEWIEWVDIDIAVNIDLANMVFRMSGNKAHDNIFKSIDAPEKMDADDSTYFIFRCTDSNNEKCKFVIGTYKDGGMRIIVEYEHSITMYNMVKEE